MGHFSSAWTAEAHARQVPLMCLLYSWHQSSATSERIVSKKQKCTPMIRKQCSRCRKTNMNIRAVICMVHDVGRGDFNHF